MKVPLASPFEHIVVEYPFDWARPAQLHVEDQRMGEGTVYRPEYALALARAILTAMNAGPAAPEAPDAAP